jgi:hypothetical protein
MSAGGDSEAIYVGLEAPAEATVGPERCPDNSGRRSTEWEFFALVSAEIERAFCVDRDDEQVVGKLSGAALVNMLGCYFGARDPSRAFAPELKLRAQYSVASRLPIDLPDCAGPIGALFIHDVNEAYPPGESVVSLDRILKANGCAGSPTAPWGTGAMANVGCRKYVGCPSAAPVVFCETTNRGRQSGYASLIVPAFHQLERELTPAR